MKTYLRFLDPVFICLHVIVHTALSDDASTSAPLFSESFVAPYLQERMDNKHNMKQNAQFGDKHLKQTHSLKVFT